MTAKDEDHSGVTVDGSSLTIDSVVRVARAGAEAKLSAEAAGRMARARAALEKKVDAGETIYAVNTGVGDLVDVRIPHDDLRALQVNLLRSHACGVGEAYPAEVVRGMMLLRANALAKGYSGVRAEVAMMFLEMLNRQVHPRVPRQGSVGSSGDLAMLAHMGLALIGEGESDAGYGFEPSAKALERKSMEPLVLGPKEAISIINGTQAMTAVGALAVNDAANLVDNAQVVAALSLEALKGTASAFDERISKVRPHTGQAKVARNMTSILKGSDIALSHRHCSKVQDAYTLRCIPQVIGASMVAVAHARDVVQVEINSATDNPLFFPDDGLVVSGGNFHGQPIALVMDYLGLAVHELGSFSERRTARLVDHKLSGLPAFLTGHGGVSSGMMVPQYVAASIVSENKVLVHPSSADSIPTSANQEDHNSMGTTGAWKARTILSNVERVMAIELLAAAQGLDFIQQRSSRPVERVRTILRAKVPTLNEDRSMSEEIETVARMISSGVFVGAVEGECKFEHA